MSIATELTTLAATKTAIATAIQGKGGVTAAKTFAQYAAAIDSIDTYKWAWQRPSDWLAMPTVAGSTQKFVGLLAVYDNDMQKIALNVAGNYTVDWGDGSATENIASGVDATHSYTYSSISSSTLSTRGYKQVLVTITPQSGQNLTNINLNVRNAAFPASSLIPTPWLDIIVGSPSMSVLRIGSTSTTAATINVSLVMLERVRIISHAITDMGYLFYGCFYLQIVEIASTAAVTSMQFMFSQCRGLVVGPALNTSGCTNISSMFFSCVQLVSVPDNYDTSLVTNMTSTFNNCIALKKGPAWNTAAVTTPATMFSGCSSLLELPSYNWGAVTTYGTPYNGCNLLRKIGVWTHKASNTSSVYITSMQSIVEIPAVDMSGMTTTWSGPFTTAMPWVQRSRITGIRVSHSYSGAGLGPVALNEVFTNLGTALASAAINITNNPGAAACTRSIATGKGWTVTG